MDDSPATGAAGRDLATYATVLLVGAVVLMGIIASAKGWIPTGDDAFLSLRTRHLLQRHPILLNNASSAGPSAGSQYNHPGAFPLTLLAPVSLIGGPGSIPLATALVNATWIALISVMVRRIGGRSAQLVAVLTAALLVWSMGATLLIDPWNPDYGIWPVAAMIIAAWGVRCHHHRMLAVAVLAASVAFQTHLSLTVPAAAAALWALAGFLAHWRHAGTGVPGERRLVTRSFVVAIVVGLIANAQMLLDEMFGSGNLSKIIKGTGFKEATVSVRQIAAVLVSKLAIPPLWLRGSWSGPVLLTDLPSTAAIIAGSAVVLALSVAAILLVRRRVPALSSLFGVLAVTAVPAALVATKFPLRIGIPLPYFRWVWPVAAIWSAAVAAALTALTRVASPVLWRRVATGTATPHHRTGGVGGFLAGKVMAAVVVVLVATAFIPANEDISPNPEWAQEIARPFSAAAVRETGGRQPVVVDQSILEAALWVIPAMIDQLDAAGINVRVADRVLIQQTDSPYAATGAETWHLEVRGGLQLDDAPPGGRQIARHDALSTGERHELEDLVRRLTPALTGPGAVRLTPVGRSETDANDLEHLTTGELPTAELLRSVPFNLAVARGAVEVPDVDQVDLRRALTLGALDGGRSIALYLCSRFRGE